MLAIKVGLKEVDTLNMGCRSNMSILVRNAGMELIENCISKKRHVSLSLKSSEGIKSTVKTFKNVSISKGFEFEFEFGKRCTVLDFKGDVVC